MARQPCQIATTELNCCPHSMARTRMGGYRLADAGCCLPHCLQAFEASAEAVKTAEQQKTANVPFSVQKPTVELVKVTKDMKVRGDAACREGIGGLASCNEGAACGRWSAKDESKADARPSRGRHWVQHVSTVSSRQGLEPQSGCLLLSVAWSST